MAERNLFADDPEERPRPAPLPPPNQPAPAITPAIRGGGLPNLFDEGPKIPQPRASFNSFAPGQFNRPFGELKPTDPSWSQYTRDKMLEGQLAIGVKPHVARHFADATMGIGGATPMGTVLSGADLTYNLPRGNYGAAALDVLGMAPGISMARRAARGVPTNIPAHEMPAWLRDPTPASMAGPPHPSALGWVTPSTPELIGSGRGGVPLGSARQGYNAIENSPVRYHPNSGHDLYALITQAIQRPTATGGGFTRHNAPQVYGILDDFAQRTAQEGRLLTPADLDTLRQQLRGLPDANGPAGYRAIDVLDTWMTSTNPRINSRIVQGAPQDVADMRANFQQARGDYRAGSTSQAVENAIDRADTRTGANYSGVPGNQTRQNMAAFSTTDAGANRIPGATREEMRAIHAASQGTPAANVERTIGNMLGGGSGVGGGVISGTVATGAGAGAHMLGFDPVSSLIIGGGAGAGAYGLGRGMRRASNERIVNMAEDAATQIRRNSPEYARRAALPENAPVQDLSGYTRDMIAMALMPQLKQQGGDVWNNSFVPYENRQGD